MQQSNQPPKYVIPFAQNDASKATIPPTSADDTRASQSQGFPARTGLPPEAGGVPPQKADMNGALNQLAGPILWSLAGGRFPFDNAFATDSNIGGYPLGSNLPAADGRGEWYSTINDNTANPDTAGTGWVPGYHYGATALSGQTGGNVTLTPAQAAKRVITVAGTLTSNLVLIVPSWRYDWTVYNNTSGAFSVSVRTAGGSAAAIPQNGAPTPVVCDGTNCSLLAANVAPATSGTQAVRLDQVGGRLLGVQRITASGTYTPTTGTGRIVVEMVGGGGAGAGAANTSAGQASVGGGGGAGAYVRFVLDTVPASVAVTIGAGGTGGTGTGGNGSPTSFGAFATAPGGTGGVTRSAAPAPAVIAALAGAGGAAPTSSGVTVVAASPGAPGITGIAVEAGTYVAPGAGGVTPFGSSSGVAQPAAPANSGAGGNGAGAVAPAGPQTGGSGGSGVVVVWEYA